MRVLIVAEGRSTGALAAVRSLSVAGMQVDVASPDARSLAGASRRCSRVYGIPSPVDGVEAYIGAVAAATRAGGHDVALPGGDAELLTLSAHRDELADTIVPYPAHDLVVRLVDKGTMADMATAAGLRVPRRAARDLPVVVKARRHWQDGADATRHEVTIAATAEERDDAIAAVEADGGEAVVQEHIPGQLLALILLVGRDGRIAGRVQQRALRTNPPQGGVSARAVTEVVDERLAERAARMLQAAGWWGPVQLQFVDGGSDEPAIVDVNPRLYGSMSLARRAGVDIATWWVREAAGERQPDPGDARTGVRYQWLEGDVRAAADFGDLLGAARWWHGAVGPLGSVADPAPAFAHAVDLVGRASRKLRSRWVA